MAVRNRIGHYRAELGLTLIEFASLVVCHPSQVSRWENHQSDPGVETYWRIWQRLKADHYPDLHIEDLMEPASE